MRKPLAAFTLIELAVVMVVMGLLASLTVMTFGGTMDRYSVDESRRGGRVVRRTHSPPGPSVARGKRSPPSTDAPENSASSPMVIKEAERFGFPIACRSPS